MTWRELHTMAWAHQRTAWSHTSSVIMHLMEPHRDRKRHRKPFAPWEFMPSAFAAEAKIEARKQRKRQAIPSDMSSLKMFVPKGSR